MPRYRDVDIPEAHTAAFEVWLSEHEGKHGHKVLSPDEKATKIREFWRRDVTKARSLLQGFKGPHNPDARRIITTGLDEIWTRIEERMQNRRDGDSEYIALGKPNYGSLYRAIGQIFSEALPLTPPAGLDISLTHGEYHLANRAGLDLLPRDVTAVIEAHGLDGRPKRSRETIAQDVGLRLPTSVTSTTTVALVLVKHQLMQPLLVSATSR